MQLAAEVHMTPRNIRAYQSRGLLQPPIRLGRRAVYGPAHLDRLLEVRRAHAAGASLDLIRSALDEAGHLPTEPAPAALVAVAALGGAAAGGSTAKHPLDGAAAGELSNRAPDLVARLIRLGVLDGDPAEPRTQPVIAAGIAALAGAPDQLLEVLALTADAAEAAVNALDGAKALSAEGGAGQLGDEPARTVVIRLICRVVSEAIQTALRADRPTAGRRTADRPPEDRPPE